jgi:hypothetical protein
MSLSLRAECLSTYGNRRRIPPCSHTGFTSCHAQLLSHQQTSIAMRKDE